MLLSKLNGINGTVAFLHWGEPPQADSRPIACMATITGVNGSKNLEARTPLLHNNEDLEDGEEEEEQLHDYVDYKGLPSKRSSSGGWRSAAFILCKKISTLIIALVDEFMLQYFSQGTQKMGFNRVVGVMKFESLFLDQLNTLTYGAGSLERFAFRGVECNLINYVTGPLGESMAVGAANVNIWTGLGSIMPLFGGFLADSVLGVYRTNIFTSIVYILGLCLTTICVLIISSTTSNEQEATNTLQILFFVSIYLVALSQGFQSSIQVFGADQFDRGHPEESKANSSFFNWWLFGLSIGVVLAYLIVPYIQENISWGIGFGITCLAMLTGLILLLLGNQTYRFAAVKNSPNHDAISSSSSQEDEDQESLQTCPPQQSSQTHEGTFSSIGSVNKGYPSPQDSSSSKKNTEVKKTRTLLPIWCTTVLYTIAWAQALTFFTKQANTVDRSIGQTFKIPSASLRTFIPLTTMCFTPVYDRVFVPVAKMVTGNPTGITEFQRIKIGMTLSIFDMVIAALVEKRRLGIARDHGLIDIPNAIVPMSFWWLVPQNVLCSIAYVFTQVGMQKFFYDRVPVELRSIGLSLAYGAFGAGNFLSSFLIYAIDKSTSLNGRYSWLCDNLSRAHLDYFYWVLAGLGFFGSVGFAFLAKSFSQGNVVEK